MMLRARSNHCLTKFLTIPIIICSFFLILGLSGCKRNCQYNNPINNQTNCAQNSPSCGENSSCGENPSYGENPSCSENPASDCADPAGCVADCKAGGCTDIQICPETKLDPLERWNRGIYDLNKLIDRVIIKPVALVYDTFVPNRIQCGVGNFFQNLSEIPNVINDVLQGKFCQASNDLARLLVNSTWGLGGVFDVASLGGLPRHREDFGLTLGAWGWENSTYLVVPLIGPSNVRDLIGRTFITYYMNILPYIKPSYLQWDLYAVELIHNRADFIKNEQAMDCVSLDEYVFVRNAYLQRRCFQIHEERPASPIEQNTTLSEPPL